ncbi:Uncharacterized protein SCF082_LOCUS21090 [Durusdinium trenchii]|uniref:Uncharacterized protein n=1 Tax=Durusdinium trenchii TaxID=1381693 RepID=A0ABP0L861_9DINO
MKFKTKKAEFKLKPAKGEGLSGNKVTLKGAKKKKKQPAPVMSFLKMPDDDEEDAFFDEIFEEPDDVPRSTLKTKHVVQETDWPSSASEDPEPFAPSTGPPSNPFDSPPPSPRVPDAPPSLSGSSSGPRSSDDDDMSSVISAAISMTSSASGAYPLDPGLERLKQKQPSAEDISRAEMEEAEKSELLMQFHILKGQGVRFSKNYTAKSSLAELRMEMGRIEHEREKANSMRRLRRQMLTLCGGAERLGKAGIMPRKVRGSLNGFSEFVLDNLQDYDTAFEGMSERYGGVLGGGSTGRPLVDFFITIMQHLVLFFIMKHTSVPKEPTEEEIRAKHPALIQRIAKEEAERIRREQQAYYAMPPPVTQQPTGLQPDAEVYNLNAYKPAPNAIPKKKPALNLSSIDVSAFSSAPLPDYEEVLPEPVADLEKSIEAPMPRKRTEPRIADLENGMKKLTLKGASD